VLFACVYLGFRTKAWRSKLFRRESISNTGTS